MSGNPYALTADEFEKILSLKREIHSHPETAFEEYETTRRIKEFLETIPGVEILKSPLPTGAVARISGNGKGDEVMLRADIDALSVTELYESPYRSKIEGKMHACGHDFHTASLIGAAQILSRLKAAGKLENTVDLLFQPAEEGAHGAGAMLSAGLFDIVHPARCFGLHNWPSVPTGKIVCKAGGRMAAKRNFEITIRGVGGHGSMPHLNRDAIVAAAAIVTAAQTIVSRNTDPLDSLVLSINKIESGVIENVTADKAVILGTIRSLSNEALENAVERLESIVKNVSAGYGCEGSAKWDTPVPALINPEELLETARKAVVLSAGEDAFFEAPPTLASEDFACYQEKIPSFFFWVGSTAEGEEGVEVHRPYFHTDDEAMKTAAALLAAAADISFQL